MKNILAIMVALAMIAIPSASQAASFDMSVILNTAQYASGHHWKVQIDNAAVIPSSDTFSYVVGELYGTVPMKNGTNRWVSVGSISNFAGVTQFFDTGSTSDFTCLAPYTKAFNNTGCMGTPELWGLGLKRMVVYEMDFYPAVGPQPDTWEYWTQDVNGVYHGVATLVNATGTLNNPHASGAAVYPGNSDLNHQFPQMGILFSHPLTWQGGIGWIDVPSASSSVTFSSTVDYVLCPEYRALNVFPDSRTWLVGNPTVFPLPICTTPSFF